MKTREKIDERQRWKKKGDGEFLTERREKKVKIRRDKWRSVFD